MKIPLCLLIGEWGVMRLKITPCLVREGPCGRAMRVCLRRTRFSICPQIPNSVSGPFFSHPQNALIKSQRCCGHMVMTNLFTENLFSHEQQLPVSLFSLPLFCCSCRPQCFLYWCSDACKDTGINNEPIMFAYLPTYVLNHAAKHKKVLQTQQPHNRIGFNVHQFDLAFSSQEIQTLDGFKTFFQGEYVSVQR